MLSVVCGKVDHPVAYYSSKLSPAETNYSATEFEGLAVVAVIMFIDVETDHQALSFLQSTKHLNGRLARWVLQLLNFNFTMSQSSLEDYIQLLFTSNRKTIY